MNILIVNYEYPPLGGGAGNATRELARQFTAHGHKVLVLTSRFCGQPPREETDGFTLCRVTVCRRRMDRCSSPEMLTFIASACRQAGRVAREFHPAITLAFFGIPGGPVALWLKKRRGVPYVISLRGGDVPGHQRELGFHHALVRPAIRAIWRGAAGLVANSHGLADLARKTLPVGVFEVIPNGVDTDRFCPRADIPLRGEEGIRLLYVGRLSPEKGLGALLEALAHLRYGESLSPEWTLEIVGDGPERARLEGLADRYCLWDRIQWRGWIERDQIADVYRGSDIFVFPSHGEGMPNSVLEAVASGLPVVAGRARGTADVIEDDRSGLLFDPGSASQMEDRIGRLLADSALRQRLGKGARNRAEEFSWERAAREYEELFRRVVESGGKPLIPAS